MISPRRILAILTFATLAGCASPSEPDRSGAGDTTPNANTTDSPPTDTTGRGGNVMGGGH
jgi:hypothetical protein